MRRPIPRYPQAIEQWWQDKAQEKWPSAGKSRILNLLRQEITIQSDRFNKEREFDPMSYGSRDLSILTYGSFFFPRTWIQLSLVLAEAIDFRGWEGPRTGPLQILDLGAGSGSGGLAALRLLRDRGVMNPIELKAIDYSGKCLSYLRNVHADLDHLWPNTLLTTEAMDLTKNLPSKSKSGYDFVLLNSTLNEITSGEDAQKMAQRLTKISQLLNPGGFIVIVEPALKAICHKLHQAATALVKDDDLHLHGPYFNGAPCPFASRPSRYHSHEVRRRAPPASVQQLNEPLRLAVHDVKFGFVLLSRKKPVPLDESPAVLRLVSPLMKKKGVRSFVGIGGDNEERSYEIQNRDLTIEGRRFVKKFERGDILHLKEWKSFEDGRRIRIPSADAVDVLWTPR
ncbi:MAG: methyltransferase domain-containing protein [Opitutales bacterium]